MIFIAVFLLSFASLAFEVLLPRIFAIIQWHHLSFMAISIALFGFAAAGTVLSLFDPGKKGWELRLADMAGLESLACLFAGSAVLSFLVLKYLPFDYFRLPVAPVQFFYLLAIFLALAVPFFMAGLAMTAAFAALPGKTGLVYAASMAGSAAGALFPLWVLPVLGEGRLAILASLIPLSLVGMRPMVGRRLQGKPGPRVVQLVGAGIVLGSSWLCLWQDGKLVSIQPSPYKALSQIQKFPGTRVVESHNRIEGRVDAVTGPHIRFAPGLSLKYPHRLPDQWAVFKDADHRLVFYDTRDQERLGFARWMLSYAAYGLSDPGRVLIVQDGGGAAIACARGANAAHITILEKHPLIARMLSHHYGMPVVNQSPRSWLQQNHERFDIIQVESWGPSLPGAGALTQSHLFTLEAFDSYISHLSPSGVLAISRKLKLPPADTIRLWASAYEALARRGTQTPHRHIVVLRNWDTITVLVFAQPLRDSRPIMDFTENLNFDRVYLHALPRHAANRYSTFDAPYHYDQLQALARACQSRSQSAYFKHYLLDAAPQTDNRPFPNHFLKWNRLAETYKTVGSRAYAMFLSGELVVVIVFLAALLISLLLLIAPRFRVANSCPRPPVTDVGYFAGIGFGFIFTELFFIHQYTFLLGDPTISFTCVISCLLVFSGAGGVYSQHLKPGAARRAFFVLIGCLAIFFWALPASTPWLLSLPDKHRLLIAIIGLLPPGFLLGIPFSLGMRCRLKTPSHRAYAWSVNGCASVLASVMSAQIAISFGFLAILAAAMAAYLIAAAMDGG